MNMRSESNLRRQAVPLTSDDQPAPQSTLQERCKKLEKTISDLQRDQVKALRNLGVAEKQVRDMEVEIRRLNAKIAELQSLVPDKN